MIDVVEIKRRFNHHPPTSADVRRHEDLRKAYLVIALLLAALPEGREKSLAFTDLETSSFWAHASVARPAPRGGDRQ